VVTCQP